MNTDTQAFVDAFAASQRECAQTMIRVELQMDRIEHTLDRTHALVSDTEIRLRSLEAGQAEMKELLLRALDRRQADGPGR